MELPTSSAIPTIRRVCPAKVNLYLKILGRRPDGYHDLITVMQPLTLADELTLAPDRNRLTLICDHPDLPQGEDNLVFRAARLFELATGLELRVRLTLHKRLPVAAGLGGGSSDAAGCLLALNTLAGGPLDMAALHRLGARLGADVPFFLRPGPAVGRGIGTELAPFALPPYWYVLANPGFSLSTRWVYENLDLKSLKVEEELDLEKFSRDNPGAWVKNDLESVTLKRHPEMLETLKELGRLGAQARGMSGSGPTLFGIFGGRASAQTAALELRKTFSGWIGVARGLTGSETDTAWENDAWTL
jgi:4-diphosphocytidyl-2-C-methyl-D-erythritol kinase